MGYLISETAKEAREQIVAESLGNIEANCDGCMSGLGRQIGRMGCADELNTPLRLSRKLYNNRDKR